MSRFSSHTNLSKHHQYQLEVVFLFILGILIAIPFGYLVNSYNKNLLIWQWYFFVPWAIIFITISLYSRAKIPKQEFVTPKKTPIIHWIILSLLLIIFFRQPTTLETLHSIDFAIILFTIFLADGYLDFKKMKLHS